ncbi:hypothetical protein D9M69_503510 [compost metagenome]
MQRSVGPQSLGGSCELAGLRLGGLDLQANGIDAEVDEGLGLCLLLQRDNQQHIITVAVVGAATGLNISVNLLIEPHHVDIGQHGADGGALGDTLFVLVGFDQTAITNLGPEFMRLTNSLAPMLGVVLGEPQCVVDLVPVDERKLGEGSIHRVVIVGQMAGAQEHLPGTFQVHMV